ncbi:hypothetical protein Aph01nite_32580 [Acrocarpospora phusangensis]|uniref:Uncharacterized protein n=1 Tax=Acrocarpospora phusangensis TaxID=1070424 RepID=A0A919UP31_9ACTN|nr:DUF6412 domain-containing protein [Acrocarpospora phusangensis]GIH24948.1 hypothetical protein Aph01nite_32580 [Acrocarpospora phusangensis]
MILQALLGLLALPVGVGVLTALGLLLLTWALGRLAVAPRVPSALAGVGVEATLVRLRHPDTAGRPRPRAPSGTPALV